MMHGVLSGTHSHREARMAAARWCSGRSLPTSQHCSRTSFCSTRRTSWQRCGLSPPVTSRVRQHRRPAQSAAADATGAISSTSEPTFPRDPWPQVRRLALTAGCCIAWLWVASTFQAASPFAAISFGFRSAAQTGKCLCYRG